MKTIIAILKVLLCKHDFAKLEFIRNIGGDEMMRYHVKGGLAKSEWYCKDCGRKLYKSYRIGEA